MVRASATAAMAGITECTKAIRIHGNAPGSALASPVILGCTKERPINRVLDWQRYGGNGMFDRNQILTWVTVVSVVAGSMSAAHSQAPPVLQVEFAGKNLFGMPVHWGFRDAAILENDGNLRLIEVDQVRRMEVLDQDFRPQSLSVARSHLQAELGSEYETLICGPYVLATPTGKSARWKSRFAALLSGYIRYFEVRGWPLRTPDFPLIVIVFRTRAEFVDYVARDGSELIPQAVGGYLRKSNRCVLYQIPGAAGTDWNETEATIVHEAVHQLAYNTGVHERLFDNPLWFVEGLATMFEVAGVYELGVRRGDLTSRMNNSQLSILRPIAQDKALLESHVRSLIASDELFRFDGTTAYAVGWGLNFYLSERMPGEYRQFIQLINHKGFGIYGERERQRDFHRTFQTDPAMLAVQMNRLFAQ